MFCKRPAPCQNDSLSVHCRGLQGFFALNAPPAWCQRREQTRGMLILATPGLTFFMVLGFTWPAWPSRPSCSKTTGQTCFPQYTNLRSRSVQRCKGGNSISRSRPLSRDVHESLSDIWPAVHRTVLGSPVQSARGPLSLGDRLPRHRRDCCGIACGRLLADVLGFVTKVWRGYTLGTSFLELRHSRRE